MALTQEQIEDFKTQIIQQIESSFSEEKKEPAIKRINSMNNPEFIEFLGKNNLLPPESGEFEQDSYEKPEDSNQSPFRLIIEGKIPSYLIEESKTCIAVLEIKPISKAHTIIIPKKQLKERDKIPQPILSLAKKISKKIQTLFKPKEILISPSFILGEVIINILPVYSNETLSSPRKQISKEELESLKSLLEIKQKPKKIKEIKIKKLDEQRIWLPRRIP